MRRLTLSLSFIMGCLVAPATGAKTLDLESGGLSGVTTDGLGAQPGTESAAILRGQKVAEAVAAMARELEVRGDYQTILAAAPAVIEIAPGNIRLRHLHALSLAASGDSEAARQILEEFPEDADPEVWGALARAMILREGGAAAEARGVTEAALERAPGNAYAHNLAGTIAFAQGALDRAETHFAKAAGLQPQSDTYLANLGAVQRLRGKNAAAASTLQTALEINPDACGARINYAGVLQDTGDLAGAAAALEACLDVEPGNSFAARQIIEVLIAGRQFDQARARAAQHADSLPDAPMITARLALLLGQPDEAETALKDAAEGPEAQVLATFAAAGRGDLAAATDIARALPPATPEHPDIALAALGFVAAAGKAQAAPAAPERSGFAYLRGLSAAVAGDDAMMRQRLITQAPGISGLVLTGFPEAQITRLAGSPAAPWLAASLTHALANYHRLSYEAAIRATEADPELALAHILKARGAAELGQTQETLAALDEALRLAPGAVAPNLQRGEAAMSLGDLPRAVRHFQQVLEVEDNASAALRLGLVADELGEDEIAIAAYERMIRISPDAFVGYNQLAWFLASRERDLDRALDLARKADTLMPGNASIQDTIGWILHLQGDTETGIAYLRRSFNIAGWEIPTIGLHLAEAELSLGNDKAARELLTALAERPEGDPHGDKARDVLKGL